MRTVGTHLLEEKIDEAVTHYINSHQQNESMHVDPTTLSINVQDEGGTRVMIMHSQSFSSQMCNSRQVSVQEPVGDGPWNEELMDPDSRIAALAAHLAQHSRVLHHQLSSPHHKVPSNRGEVDSNVMLDNTPLRLYNGQTLDSQSDNLVVHMPSSLPPLPPLQGIKRNQETDWFNKTKTTLKDDGQILDSERPLELGAGASPAQQRQQSKKSLPHKKRISKKLKRNNGSSTPQQVCDDMVVINCTEEVHHEEILPDNFVTAVQHQDQLPEDSHHMTQVRPMFICQLCGDFYGEEQLKFYHHLKQHYEPHGTIIIENPVNDLGIDKMTNTCIVDNVAALPDSIVELSLENTMPKTSIYHQPIDKHILYSTSDKTLHYASNKLQYSMASMDKEPVTSEAEKAGLYESLEKVELYSCTRCNKSFRKQKHCEQHIKEAHSKYLDRFQLEEMSEFSEPEDLMEGIHVTVEGETDHYDQTLLPHLTVENGHIHQDHMRQWLQVVRSPAGPLVGAAAEAEAAAEGAYFAPLAHAHNHVPEHAHEHVPEHENEHEPEHEHERAAPPSPHHLKEEVFQRIFEGDMDVPTTDNQSFPSEIIHEPSAIHPDEPLDENSQPPDEKVSTEKLQEENGSKKKGLKTFTCPQCPREFNHRNSLLYHVQRHKEKRPFECAECGKGFYTNSALKVHGRVHNGDKPYKCDDCGRDFRQWGDLKYHMVSLHSNKKLYKCEFCDKDFARKYSLSVHRRIHTGEKNYKCEYCPKTFRASSYRLTHMQTHTGYRPHKCPLCDKPFRVRSDLRRHLQTHEKRKANEAKLREVAKNKPKIKPPDLKEDIKIELVDHSEQFLSKVPTKKIAVASTTTVPTPKTAADKKSQTKVAKKAQKKSPNVTVAREPSLFKTGDYPSNVEVFDTRQGNAQFTKFKEVYSDNNIVVTESINYVIKNKEAYEHGQQKVQERDFATLKPMFAPGSANESEGEKHAYAFTNNKTDNTDGKIFTHVEKTKPYTGPIVANSQVNTNNPRTNDPRDGRTEMNGDTIDNGFLERFSAFYNIPAV